MPKNEPEYTHFESLYPDTTRDAEIDQILSYIKNGNSAQVVGLPGVGRSNLLRFLAYNNKARVKHLGDNYKWYHFVYLDLSEIKGRNLSELTKFILISLSYSLSERKMEKEQEKVNSFLKEVVTFSDDLILFQALKKAIDYLSLEKELTTILVFDRFDSYFGSLNPEFFTNLHVLRNRVKYRFSCVFSLERPIEDTLEPELYKEFYEFVVGNTVYLPIKDNEANLFRFSYIERASGKTASEKTKNEILELTGGHGKLSRISFEAMLADDKLPDDFSLFLLSKASVKGALLELWNALTPLEQKHIFKNDLKELEPTSFLLLSGLVSDGKIQIPLLVSFLPQLPQPATEKIEFFPETNEIKQGNESLTDKLSPSEFKLLRYLAQNKDKVCEKEEIINAVWSDAATQEGVTDQALDQIVYRLRRKIETDPNTPIHLHTIKGRGYRFSE